MRETEASAQTEASVPSTGRLLYLMGASGSGKDSLIAWTGAALTPHDAVLIAHRYVTRTPGPAEPSIALSETQFTRWVELRAFALHWRSHGLAYGIGLEIDAWLARGITVLVNGSREYLPQAAARYRQLEAIEVVVAPDILRDRLLRRGRESAAAIEQRLARATQSFPIPAGCRFTRIRNDAALDMAGTALLALLRERPGPLLPNNDAA